MMMQSFIALFIILCTKNEYMQRRSLNKKIDQAILSLVESRKLSDQSELLQALCAIGISLTQSTLSRRLKRLGITKKQGSYAVSSLVFEDSKGLVKNISLAPPNLMVLHTLSGYAQALACQIDSVRLETSPPDEVCAKILGTIAGDDTVLVVASSQADLDAINAYIQSSKV